MHTGQGKSREPHPTVWLMSDERVGEADLMRAIGRLPRGGAVIVRHYGLDQPARRALFLKVQAAARRRQGKVLLAGDPALAQSWGADGHHGLAPGPRGKPWLHSAPVHSSRELRQARRSGANVVLISPLFATQSHPGACPLGPSRFSALARQSTVPVIALGGLHPRHRTMLRGLGATGFAAIDGLTPRRRHPPST